MNYQAVLQNYVVNKEKPPMLYIAILANDLHGTSQLLCEYYKREPNGEKTVWSISQLLDVVSEVHKFVPSEARGSLLSLIHI